MKSAGGSERPRFPGSRRRLNRPAPKGKSDIVQVWRPCDYSERPNAAWLMWSRAPLPIWRNDGP